MRKVLSLAVVGLFSTLMIGCGLNDPEQAAPRITLSSIGTINAGSFKNVEGKIEGDTAITSVKYEILKGGVAATDVTVSGPTASSTETLDFTGTDAIKITASSTASGDYVLRITAEAGVTGTADFAFTVGGGSTALATGTVTLGAQDAAAGSSVDLDAAAPAATTSAAAKAAGAAMDLVYAYSENAAKGVGPVLMSPNYAATESGITAFASWTGASATTFHKVSVNFDTATKEQLSGLYNASSAVERLVVAANDVVIVKTSTGAYALVRMDTVSANGAGTATIKYGK